MKTQIVMALSCLSALTAWTANPGLEIKTLGQTNTMVRITDPKPILLLPVEESCADSRVNILVNGEFRGAFYIRLAANTTDYSVPFDLTPYTSEGEVLLNIITPADRSVLGGNGFGRQLQIQKLRILPPGLSPRSALGLDERPQRHVL